MPRKTTSSSFAQDYTHKGIVMIDTDHYWTHQGAVYQASGKFSVLTTATQYWLVKPNSNVVHLRSIHIGASDGPCDVYFFESPTTSANGTAITAYNHSRLSSNTSTVGVYHTPTVSADGTQLQYSQIHAGGPGANVIGTTSDSLVVEIILDPSKDYLVKLVNNGSGTATVNFGISWYEPN